MAGRVPGVPPARGRLPAPQPADDDGRAARERDNARYNAFPPCPEVRRVLRFTAREVFTRPGRVTATIRTALAERAAAPA
ncbi:hypothetical protein [Streptomyces filamentosus]|uniref:hypothetical protein n=1 Tax=Streptomyces filamentosus TaxID=67294 RepID=UPI00123B919D|nr:hypothetical protein [Streptomyces filamentosus]KAA6219433.1 hypothetical protein CP979_22995 [Streptomyces filamentosus]